MLWPCLGRHMGEERNLFIAGLLGVQRRLLGFRSVVDQIHRTGFLSATHSPNSLHPGQYSFFLSVSACCCLFPFLQVPKLLSSHTHQPIYRAMETFEYAWKVFLEVGSWVGGAMGSREQQKQQHQRWPHDSGTGRCKRRLSVRDLPYPGGFYSLPLLHATSIPL